MFDLEQKEKAKVKDTAISSKTPDAELAGKNLLAKNLEKNELQKEKKQAKQAIDEQIEAYYVNNRDKFLKDEVAIRGFAKNRKSNIDKAETKLAISQELPRFRRDVENSLWGLTINIIVPGEKSLVIPVPPVKPGDKYEIQLL